MKRTDAFPKLLVISAVAIATTATTPAYAGSCSNTCVTMAIPRSEDGVITKLDGTADAVLWPPSRDLRTIHVSALNDLGSRCDVTIRDVKQDEARRETASGHRIEDAVNCTNEGESSSIQLRSDRSDDGNGRSYHIEIALADPDCDAAVKADEVLVVVPREEVTLSLRPDEDQSTLTASYAGHELQCSPAKDDRLARSDIRHLH